MAAVRLAVCSLSLLLLCGGCLDDYGGYDFVTDFDGGAVPSGPGSTGAPSSAATPTESTASSNPSMTAAFSTAQTSAPPADSSEFDARLEPVAEQPPPTQVETTH